jgi:hypothetical protein
MDLSVMVHGSQHRHRIVVSDRPRIGSGHSSACPGLCIGSSRRMVPDQTSPVHQGGPHGATGSGALPDLGASRMYAVSAAMGQSGQPK